MFLYLIRHGEPDYENDTLTKLGIKQVRLLSERFSSVKFDRIFSSPLGRARQTAIPTCIKQNKNYEVLPWLSEDLAYNAMVTDIEGKPDWWFSVQNTKIITPEGAQKYESNLSQSFYASTASSFDNLLSELGYQKCVNEVCTNGVCTNKVCNSGYRITSTNNKNVAFFCHDGISRILLSYALLIPFHILCASFSISHTGVTVLHYADTNDKFTSPRCLMFSDLSHLYKASDVCKK